MINIHSAITERFLEQLNKGTVPWQMPWLSAQNIVVRKPYRGINALLLNCSRFDSPYWMTFRQARELGGIVKAGERSTPIIYYNFVQKYDAQGEPVFTNEGKPRHIPFLRWSNIFNLQQTEGITAPALAPSSEIRKPLERAEAIVQEAILCPIHNEGFAATYSPLWDAICIPAKAKFRSEEDYFHTLYHEMTHATGHKSRLNREGIVQPIKFGTERYSKEELIAELGAAFLSNEAGILNQVRFDNSAAYLNSWVSRLKDDHTLIISAASQAQRSSDLILGIKLTEVEQERTSLMSGAENPPLAASKTHLSNGEEELPPPISRISPFINQKGKTKIQP